MYARHVHRVVRRRDVGARAVHALLVEHTNTVHKLKERLYLMDTAAEI